LCPLSTAFSMLFTSLNLATFKLAEEAEPALGWQRAWKKRNVSMRLGD